MNERVASATLRSRRARHTAAAGPALDLDRLIAALKQLARTEGLDALNMRRVAETLGVSARLLYQHIRSKQDMIDLLTDEIIGLCDLDLVRGSWQLRLRNAHVAMRAAYLDYPGAAAIILTRMLHASTRPHASAIRDGMFEIFRDAGLDRQASEIALVQFAILTLGGLVAHENADGGAELIMSPGRVGHAVALGIEMLIADVERIVGTGVPAD